MQQEGRVTVREGQSAFDIAIQEYGSIEGIAWLLEDNQDIGLNLNSNIRPGTELIIRNAVINQAVVDKLTRDITYLATHEAADEPYLGGDFDLDDFNGDFL